MKIIRGLSALAFMLSVTPVNAAWIYTLFDTVHITGSIQKGDNSKFQLEFTENIKRVSILSNGGNVDEALKIADALSKRDVTLQIKKYCISACASIIAPAASRRKIVEGGFLAFHDSKLTVGRSGIKLLSESALNEAQGQRLASIKATFEMFEKRLREAYMRSNPEGWNWMEVVHEITSNSAGVHAVGEGEDRIYTLMAKNKHQLECEYWVPNVDGLKEIGLEIEGYKEPDRPAVANKLGTSESRIYWGLLSGVAAATSPVCERG